MVQDAPGERVCRLKALEGASRLRPAEERDRYAWAAWVRAIAGLLPMPGICLDRGALRWEAR